MNPQAITAWIMVAQTLAGIGVDIATKLKAMFRVTNPSMTDEEMDAAFDIIIEDDRVRAALAAAASRPSNES